MAASTTIITDLTTAVANGSTAQTLANSEAPAGPIQDPNGNIAVALLKAKELKVLLSKVQLVEDGADPNQALIAGILLSLV